MCILRTGQETDIQVVEHTVTSELLVAGQYKGGEMEARHPEQPGEMKESLPGRRIRKGL